MLGKVEKGWKKGLKEKAERRTVALSRPEGWKGGGVEGLEGWRVGGLEGWRVRGLEGKKIRGLEP